MILHVGEKTDHLGMTGPKEHRSGDFALGVTYPRSPSPPKRNKHKKVFSSQMTRKATV